MLLLTTVVVLSGFVSDIPNHFEGGGRCFCSQPSLSFHDLFRRIQRRYWIGPDVAVGQKTMTWASDLAFSFPPRANINPSSISSGG